MKIILEFETVEELAGLIALRDSERDQLRDRIHILEEEPLRFSLQALARRVAEDMESLTPDQRRKCTELIERGVSP